VCPVHALLRIGLLSLKELVAVPLKSGGLDGPGLALNSSVNGASRKLATAPLTLRVLLSRQGYQPSRLL
jgi:hypothetical protein